MAPTTSSKLLQLQQALGQGQRVLLAPVATPTILNADAYDAGDTLFDRFEVPAAVIPGYLNTLMSVSVLDKDDQAAAVMTLYILKSSVVFGVLDVAPSISDVDAAQIIARVDFAAADFTDIGGSKFGFKGNLHMPLAVANSTSLWIAATTAGTPTQSTGGILVTLGVQVG